jgi:Zn-dependent protease with chaperone function
MGDGTGIDGDWFDARRSRPQRALLRLHANGDAVVELAGRLRVASPANGLQVSARLGRIPRRLTFPDGSVFETDDNDGIDRGLSLAGVTTPRSEGAIDALESRWPVALMSLAALALGSILFLKVGLPKLADIAARNTPMAVERPMGRETLRLLDRVMFEPSRLPAARQDGLRERFEAMTLDLYTKDLGRSADYRLEFRDAGKMGANALALPSGIIVLTDDLVALAQHDDEIIAVLAHEIGHVAHRHVLRSLYQSAGLAALAAAVVGDVSQVAGLVAFMPQLVEAGYSRDLEREADAFAKDWLRSKGIPARRFDDLLCRLIASHGGDDLGALRYLASHPSGAERSGCDDGKSTASDARKPAGALPGGSRPAQP